MNEAQNELDEIKAKYNEEDLAKIKKLRNYYRRHFHQGASDECFQLWLEDGLRVLNAQAMRNVLRIN